MMSKHILFSLLILFLAISGFYVAGQFIERPAETSTAPVAVSSPLVSPSTSALPSPAASQLPPSYTSFAPTRLLIPKLSVNVAVEHVGLDNDRRMAIPEDYGNAAWYKLGAKAGEMGSAVIAAHLDTPNGQPSVFYDLDKLRSGDEVIVEDITGEKHTFVVEKTALYEDAAFPLSQVFAQNDAPRLNLITCSGQFSTDANNYSHRRVVFTRLKN